MKYIYSFALVLLLASCGKDDKVIDREKTDWAYYKLNGEVESISEKSFSTVDGKQKGPSTYSQESQHDVDMQFNDEGMLIAEKKWSDAKPFEEVTYKGREYIINKTQFAGGSPSMKTDYSYDESGKNNLSITRRNTNNSPFDKVVMKYKNNLLIERITYNHQQNPTNRITYHYDKNGNLTGMNTFGSTDVIQYKTEYTYNDKNQKVRELQLKKDGTKDYEIMYIYEGDKITASKTYNANGELTYEERKSYDKQGNLATHYAFDKFDGIKLLDEYVYDDKGNMMGWIQYKDEKLDQKVSYAYDEHGNLTKMMAVDINGNVKESKIYNYEYDQKGNWIKRLLIKDDRPFLVTERTITYFK